MYRNQKGIRWDLASGLGRIRGVTPACTWRGGVTDSNSEETEELTAIQYVQLMDTAATTLSLMMTQLIQLLKEFLQGLKTSR